MKSKSLNIKKKVKKKSLQKTVQEELNDELEKENIEVVKSVDSSKKILKLNFKQNKSEKKKKKLPKIFLPLVAGILLVLLIAGILLTYFVIVPAQRVVGYIENIQSNVGSLLTDIQSKDITKIDSYFTNIKDNLDKIDSEISRYEFLKDLDQTKGYYNNFAKGRIILDKVDLLLDKSLPDLKNILKSTGFKVEPGDLVVTPITNEAGEPIEEESSLTLILKELPLYLDLYYKIEPDILDILTDVQDIDMNYVPNFANYNIKDKLLSFNKFVTEYPQTSAQAINFLKYIPSLIGSNKDVNYMVILQNEAEMRSSGGLITAFGNTQVKNGEFVDGISLQDSWNLEIYVSYTLGIDSGNRNIYGQRYLMESGCGSAYMRAQDSGIYPDLYESMSLFRDYYDIANRYDKKEYPDYDHVVIMNFKFAESILGLVQPLSVEGFGDVTPENLFEFIKAETDDPKYAGFAKDRKQILQLIADEAKEKLFNLPLDQIPNVVNTIVKSFKAKDIGLTSKGEDMQQFFDDYGLSGRTIKEFQGDYFQLNEAQNCALKLNKWVRNSVEHQVNIANNGEINRDVLVRWTQPQIWNPSFTAQYSESLQWSYRAWIRFFLPKDIRNVESDGYSRSGYLYYKPQEYYDAVMDKRVSDNIVQFDHRRFTDSDPIEKDQMRVTYKLPETLNYNLNNRYSMIIQKHPGKSWGENHKVTINQGESKYEIEFVLDQDKVLTYRNGVITVDNYDKKLDWIAKIMDGIPWDKLGD